MKTPLTMVVTDHHFGALVHEQSVAQQFGATLTVFNSVDENETVTALNGAQVAFNNFAPITAAGLAVMATDGLIIRYGVGTDNVDLVAATQAGVTVCNIPDYGTEEVADHTLAMLLPLLRRLPMYSEQLRAGQWGAKKIVPTLPAFSEVTVGLLGFGRIAQAVAKRLRPFGFSLLAHDPFTSVDATLLGVTLVDFKTLLSASNALSLHLPLSKDTQNIISAPELECLGIGSVIINVSRGGLIDETALASALKSGTIAGCGLDVFAQEPLPAESPLWHAPNLMMTPHAAFYSNLSLNNLQRLAAEEAFRFLSHQVLRCPVNVLVE